jgi:hypothetical protein
MHDTRLEEVAIEMVLLSTVSLIGNISASQKVMTSGCF